MFRGSRQPIVALVAAMATLAGSPAPGRAHAVVSHASLKNASIPAGAASETTLEFNSAIEAKLAKVTLIDDKGTEQPLTLAPGEHPANVLVVALPALTAGHYALKYKVLAALVYLRGRCPDSELDMTVGGQRGTLHRPIVWNVEEDDAAQALDDLAAGRATWGVLFLFSVGT